MLPGVVVHIYADANFNTLCNAHTTVQPVLLVFQRGYSTGECTSPHDLYILRSKYFYGIDLLTRAIDDAMHQRSPGPAPGPAPPPAPAPPPPGPACKDCPNIVLMFTDDQDLLIGCVRKKVETSVQHLDIIPNHYAHCVKSKSLRAMQFMLTHEHAASSLHNPPMV